MPRRTADDHDARPTPAASTWTEPTAETVAAGRPPHPAAAADGRPPGGQRLRPRDRRRADLHRRRLGDRVVTQPVRREPGDLRARRRRHHPLPGHPRPPRPLHPGRRDPAASSATPPSSSASATRPTLDLFNSGTLDHDPTVPRLRLAGAADIADAWQAMFEGNDPDLSLWLPPDRWLDGEQEIVVGDRVAHRRTHPGPHRRPLRLRRPRRRAALRRRPRAADDHAVGRLRARLRRRPAARLPRLARARPRACPTCGSCPPTAPSPTARTPGSTSCSPTTTSASSSAAQAVAAGAVTAYDVARQLSWTRRERALDELDIVQRRDGRDGDDGPPRPARRRRRPHAQRDRRRRDVRPHVRIGDDRCHQVTPIVPDRECARARGGPTTA